MKTLPEVPEFRVIDSKIDMPLTIGITPGVWEPNIVATVSQNEC